MAAKFKLRDAAWGVMEAIRDAAAKGPEHYLSQIPKIFEELPYAPADKSSVFWELDERYGGYGDYTKWHFALRQVRNHPVHSKQLFGAFK